MALVDPTVAAGQLSDSHTAPTQPPQQKDNEKSAHYSLLI